jgi:hypothetical protein
MAPTAAGSNRPSCSFFFHASTLSERAAYSVCGISYFCTPVGSV